MMEHLVPELILEHLIPDQEHNTKVTWMDIGNEFIILKLPR